MADFEPHSDGPSSPGPATGSGRGRGRGRGGGGGGRGRGRGRGASNSAADRTLVRPADEVSMTAYETKKAEAMLDRRTVVLNTSECKLPPLEELFASEPWEIEELIQARDALNDCKNKLDNYDRKCVTNVPG